MTRLKKSLKILKRAAKARFMNPFVTKEQKGLNDYKAYTREKYLDSKKKNKHVGLGGVL